VGAKVGMSKDKPVQPEPNRSDELLTFLFLTVVLAPVASVAIVGGYGFIVWMSQLILGPPVG